MVQATLASMRYYCPEVPICLVVDGDFDVSDLEREYDLIALRVPELPSEQMRKVICGNYRAKLAAMWEGPFERYIWLDSDAIVWGDFTSQIQTDVDFQIFWSETSIPTEATEIPAWLPHFYFDPLKLHRFDPDFEWQGKAYFSSGAFACRRNAIPFDVWERTESWARQSPGLFAWGEMGMLNYLVYAMAQREELKIAVSDLQHIGGHHGVDELKRDCSGSNWHFPQKVRRPRVAHFCGRKPFLFHRNSYSRPFTIARLEHHRSQHSELGSWLMLLNEEKRVIFGKSARRFKCWLRKSKACLHAQLGHR